jgi:AraC-like DNA-binding protein/quercetin dioxygenase-like cupin family protein
MTSIIHLTDYDLSEEHPVKVFQIDQTPRVYPPHAHEFTEFAVVLSGEGYHVLDSTTTELKEGDCFVIAPGRIHSFEELKNFTVMNVLFIERIVQKRLPELMGLQGYCGLLHWEPASRTPSYAGTPIHLKGEQRSLIVGLLRYISKEQRVAALWALGVVIAELCNIFVHTDNRFTSGFIALERAIRWIENHYGNSIALEDLAQAAAMSPATLNRRFRKFLTCSPMEFVVQERLRRAATLLRNTDLNLRSIAYTTGFSDASHLSRAFKAHFHKTIREFRSTSG